MRCKTILFAVVVLSLSTVAQEADPRAAEFIRSAYERLRGSTFLASFVSTSEVTLGGEKVFYLTGSSVWRYEPGRLRMDNKGLSEIGLLDVMIIDFEEGLLYTRTPERDWRRHYLCSDFRSVFDPSLHPIYSRTVYTSLEEVAWGADKAWKVTGRVPPGPLGILLGAEYTAWFRGEPPFPVKEVVRQEIYLPGWEVTMRVKSMLETTNSKAVEDIPDRYFQVPPDVPTAPDPTGWIFPYPAPPLSGTAYGDGEVSLSKGRTILVYFWEAPRSEKEEFQALLDLLLLKGIQDLAGKKEVPLQVITVVEGSEEVVLGFLSRYELDLPAVGDFPVWAAAFEVEGPGACVAVDREGMVRFVGGVESVPMVLEELLLAD